MEEKFNKIPDNQYHGDPSMPYFSFSESEKEIKRKAFMAEGKTREQADEEIAREETVIRSRQAAAKLSQEIKKAA